MKLRCFVLLALGCGDTPDDTSLPLDTDAPDTDDTDIDDPPTPVPFTGSEPYPPIPGIEVVDIASYLQACEVALGPWPTLRCDEATEIPVTVTDALGTRDVTQLADLEDGFRCDRSSVAGCTPATRMGTTTNSQGSYWAYGCRNTNDDTEHYDQINVIGVNPTTGATCFFETPFEEDRQGTINDVLPRPGSPEDLNYDEEPFWKPFERLARQQCLQCHDNGPFLHNPWIRQADVLPDLDPLGPYQIVAFEALSAISPEAWVSPRLLRHPGAEPCLACHAIAEGRSCRLALEATGRDPRPFTTDYFVETYPYSRWMSVFDDDEREALWPTEESWEAQWGAAADVIAMCCVEDPPEGCF